jgi:dTDP-4-dehydrorhamnose reductase
MPGKTADQRRPAARPAYSVLRTEREAVTPALPDWREGLRDYMAAVRARDLAGEAHR